MNREISLGLSFRPGNTTDMMQAVKTYGHYADIIIAFDDLGAKEPLTPLTLAASQLNHESSTTIGVMGAAVPKYLSMVDLISFASTAHDLRRNQKITLGLVPGAWMEGIGLHSATVQDMREAIESVRYLVQRKTDGYQGNRFQISPGFQLDYNTIPPDKLEIYMGAWGPRMLALAGELADGVKIGGSTNPAMVALVKERLAVGAQKVDRNVDDIGISFGAVTVVDSDREKAFQKVKELGVLYIDVIADKDPFAMEQFGPQIRAIQQAMRRGEKENAMALVTEDLLKLFAFFGTPEDIFDQARALIDAGVTRIEFGPPHGFIEMEGIKLLTEEVFPKVREYTRNHA